MLRIRRNADGDVLFTLTGRLDKEDVAELEKLIAGGGKGPPHHSRPQGHDSDRPGRHRISRSM